MVPTPVYAVLMLFPISQEYEADRQEEYERVCKARANSSPECKKYINDDIVFFKQTIGNACGTIGLLHSIANNSNLPIAKGALSNFLEQCQHKTPDERAQLLESDNTIASVHSDLAHSGQSKFCLRNRCPTRAKMWIYTLFALFKSLDRNRRTTPVW